MASIRDHVRGFLAEFPSPKETDIQKFAEEIASKDSSLDKESFKAKLLKVILQRAIIRQYENQLSYISRDSPVFKEFEKVLKEARMAHENLEDISSDLKTARELLGSLIGKNKEGQVSVDKSHQDHEAIKSIPATERSSKENISYTAHSVPEIKPEVPGKPKEEKAIPESEPFAPEIKPEVPGKPKEEKAIPESEPFAPEIKPEVPGKPKEEKAIPESEPPAPEIKPEIHEKPKEERAIPEIEPHAPEIKQEIPDKPTFETLIPENEPAEAEPEVTEKPVKKQVIPESEPH